MKALILAAGYATRLYPLTLHVPKSLLPLGHATIVDHIIGKIEEVDDISDIILVSNSKFAPLFREWASSRSFNKRLEIVDDGSTCEENRLGAIGDMQFVLESEGIGDDLLVMAGDNVFTFDLQDYVDYFFKKQRDCILVQHMDRLEDLRRVGVVELDRSRKVLSFEEKPEHPKTDIGVFALYIYRKETLPLIKTYLDEGNDADAPGYFPEWLCQRKDIVAYFAEGNSYDIGTHEAYQEIYSIYNNRMKK